jgi:spermidine synthase
MLRTKPAVQVRPRARTVVDWSTIVVYSMFLLSGFSGLVYQVVWTRQFGLLFGVTSYAIGTVLTAFFAGLALGSWLVSRWLKGALKQPLLTYSVLEVGIAGSALLVPIALQQSHDVYRSLLSAIPDSSFYLLSLVRFVVSLVVLLIPCTCMGATLPLVAEAISRRNTNVTVNVSGLYAINTFGAFVGVAFSGFYGIGYLGRNTTTWIAVAANLLAAIAALLVARQIGSFAASRAERTQQTSRRLTRPSVVATSLALSGFAAIGFEVVWSRVLSFFFEHTTAAYSTIIMAVLLGIVLGSWLVRINAARIRRPLRLLALIEILVAWISLLAIVVIAYSPAGRADGATMLLIGVTLVIPNILLGATLPIAVHHFQSSGKGVGESVGTLYAANVLGGVFGSFCTGFILLPLLGSQHTIVALASVNIAAAAWLYGVSEAPTRRVGGPWAAATAALLIVFLAQPTLLFDGINRAVYRGGQVLFNQEDVEGVVTVTEQNNVRAIYFDGSPESTDFPNLLQVHRRLAHVPLLLHPDPQDVLVIGLGSGTTAGAITQHPIERLTIVDLIPGMFKGAELFKHSNYDLMNNPKVTTRHDDGRNYLLLSEHKYDMIEADVVRPWRAGANNLYAVEYYQLLASHLKEGGIVCQWLDTSLPEEQYKLLLRTFVDTFPNTTLWHNGSYAVAMPDGGTIDTALVEARFADPDIAAALRDAGYASADDFLRSFTMGPEEIRQYVGDGPILTDDRPVLEYNALPSGTNPVDLADRDVRESAANN